MKQRQVPYGARRTEPDPDYRPALPAIFFAVPKAMAVRSPVRGAKNRKPTAAIQLLVLLSSRSSNSAKR